MARNEVDRSPRDTQRMDAPLVLEARTEREVAGHAVREQDRLADFSDLDEDDEITEKRVLSAKGPHDRDTTPGSEEDEGDAIDVELVDDLDKKFDRRSWEQMGPQGTRSPLMGLDPAPRVRVDKRR
jgi:hypothetical protein